MGYEAFYVICPRASSQYVTPLGMADFSVTALNDLVTLGERDLWPFDF